MIHYSLILTLGRQRRTDVEKQETCPPGALQHQEQSGFKTVALASLIVTQLPIMIFSLLYRIREITKEKWCRKSRDVPSRNTTTSGTMGVQDRCSCFAHSYPCSYYPCLCIGKMSNTSVQEAFRLRGDCCRAASSCLSLHTHQIHGRQPTEEGAYIQDLFFF